MESFLYSESNTTFGSGSLGSAILGTNGYEYQPHLVILPNDGNGTNFLEVPLSKTNSPQPFVLQALFMMQMDPS